MISEDIFVKDYVSSCSQEIFFHERNKRYSAIDLCNRNDYGNIVTETFCEKKL